MISKGVGSGLEGRTRLWFCTSGRPCWALPILCQVLCEVQAWKGEEDGFSQGRRA